MILEVTNQKMLHFIMGNDILAIKKIIILESIHEDALEILKNATDISIFENYKNNVDINTWGAFDAVITRGIGKVNKELMDSCPNLKVAARCGVGLDNVDVKEATKRGIKVVNAPGSNANTVAEHTVALILMLQRNLYEGINEVKSGNWASRNTFKSDVVGEKTIGIFDLGNIGLKVANIAKALGMNVIYWSKSMKKVDYQYVTKEELYSKSDIISIHLPLNAETENLFKESIFEKLKPNAILVNTARGQIVNKNDLVNALNSGKLKGYGSDVPTSPPPDANDALINHPRALITAHVSSLTATTYRNMCVSTVNNVLAILRNESPQEGCIFNLKDL